MRTDKKKQTKQRGIVEQKISRFSKLNEPPPPSGWVKAVRGSLGMTIRQLADRVGVGHGSINQIEKREPKKKVTLESLERVAQAMDCKLVYAIIPRESGATLEDILENRAREKAIKILKDVQHTMRLEAQGTSEKELQLEINRIARELKESGGSSIWDMGKQNRKEKSNHVKIHNYISKRRNPN
jgi:predicted DNA-binding mobile mystery protein A